MADKKFELVVHLLVDIKAEVLTMKDFFNASLLTNPNLTPAQKEIFEKAYEQMRAQYQTEVLAQVRARYDKTLGSVDDLLKELFSE